MQMTSQACGHNSDPLTISSNKIEDIDLKFH